MKISEIASLPNIKEIAISEDENIGAISVSDLMSDVLTTDLDNLLLITGLCNEQTIRTADIVGVVAVIISNGKKIQPKMIQMAKDAEISIFESELSNFNICKVVCKKFPNLMG